MRAALGFLTAVGGAAVPDRTTPSWFPVVGLVVGAVVGAAWWGAVEVWPPAVAAVVVIAVDLGLTGMLHVDGLADSADGLLAPMDRARRLEVMALPDTGAFGTATVVVVLLARVALVGHLPADVEAVALVAAIWCASRTLMAIVVRTGSYARPGGLAAAMAGGSWAPVAVLGAVLSVAAAWFGAELDGVVALAGVGAGFGAVVLLAQRRLGGYTGDVLGAAGIVGETVGLLVWLGVAT